MASPTFIHLRVHSEHSLLEGAVPVKKLPKLAAEAGITLLGFARENAFNIYSHPQRIRGV